MEGYPTRVIVHGVKNKKNQERLEKAWAHLMIYCTLAKFGRKRSTSVVFPQIRDSALEVDLGLLRMWWLSR